MSLHIHNFENFREETSKEIFAAEVHELLPSLKSIRRNLYKIRSSILPPLPQSVAEVRIDGQWSKTVDGRNFLLSDSGTGNDRIIVSNHLFLSNISFLTNIRFEKQQLMFHNLFSLFNV